MANDIMIFGSINIDFVARVNRFPQLGETILGNNFSQLPGGKGANQAVALTKLGDVVKFVGAVGNDFFGETLIKYLSSSGIEVSNIIVRNDCSTGIAFITVDEKGNNQIIIIPGANDTLDKDVVKGAQDLIQSSKIIILQLEIPFDSIETIINITKIEQIPIILNPSPIYPEVMTILNQVDYLIMNEIEAAYISSFSKVDQENIRVVLDKVKHMGVKNVIITLGSKGAAYLDENNNFDLITPPEVEVVDTTAAGDAFIGGFTHEILQGKSVDEAVKFANICGSITVTKLGAQTSLPCYADVINKKNELNKVIK